MFSCGKDDSETGSLAGGSLAPPESLPEINRVETEREDQKNPVWELVWSDEFEYSGKPDPDKWGYDVGGHGWGNNELQYYTEGANAEVADGILKIEARRENHGGREYTSTRLVSRDKGDWLYGKIEVRAKLPSGRGTWPAIWMLPTDWQYGNWPESGEIDIMEHVGYEPDRIHGTVHTDRFNHMKGTQVGKSVQVERARSEFHSYAVEWYHDQIRFIIDGDEYHRFSPRVYSTDPDHRIWPFDQRFHLLLNIAVGGNWGGQKGIDEDIWPAVMEIDYVRVYRDSSE